MEIINFTPLSSLAGGLVLGTAAAAMWLLLGRVTGISGITGGLVVQKPGDVAWRGAFVAGLWLTGMVLSFFMPESFRVDLVRSPLALLAAGLLVGVGTQMGSGCTSGHGICGIGRLSPRGITATLTFMLTGALVTAVITHVFGGVL